MRLLRENLLVQFSVVSFIAMIIIAVVFVVSLSNVIQSHAVDTLVHEAIADSSDRLLEAITPADLEIPMTGERYNSFDKFVQESIVSERTARVKLWAKDGTVIYSDNLASVGEVFPDNEDLLTALRGDVATEIKIPENPENEHERLLGTLIEVYTPIIFSDTIEPQGVFEIYQYYEPTAQLIANLQRRVLISTMVMFLLLYGASVGIVWGGWRTIVQQRKEQQQAEEEIRRSEEFIKTVLNSINDAISIIDVHDFTIVEANSTFLKQYGLKKEELIGKTCYQVTHHRSSPCTPPDDICPLLDTVTTGEYSMTEHVHYTEDGEKIYVEVSTSSIKDEDGKIIQVVHVSRDITRRKQAEEDLISLSQELKMLNLELEERVKERTRQLEQAVQAAEAASQAKSQFLASMSHELRTPLNAVIGFSQVLQEQYFGKLNEKQTEYVTDILESGQHLLSLINDILDLSKVEAGKMELELSKVKIRDLLESSLVMIKEKALAHGITLDFHAARDLESLEIMADARRIKQVMFNLLSNAAKFTPDGRAIRVESKKDGKELIVSISDTGIGIAPEEQKRIFEGFHQVKGGITDKTSGTGLGLSITKSIVEMHGGRLWVESEGQDKGSKFTFTLPI